MELELSIVAGKIWTSAVLTGPLLKYFIPLLSSRQSYSDEPTSKHVD